MKSKKDLLQLLGKPHMQYQKFHQRTKLIKSVHRDVSKWPVSWSTVFFKEYPRLDRVVLPAPNLSKKISLKEVLIKRKSVRVFKKNSLTLEQISNLVYYSSGYKSYIPPWRANRFYPSGGSRYPLEIYIISLHSELGRGIYHYNVKSHVLELLDTYEKLDISKYLNHTWSGGESIIVIFTAIFKRTTAKYGERGYRYILSETGNLSQNFYLVSTALDIACTTIGYKDDKINELLDINSDEESVLYAMVFGKN